MDRSKVIHLQKTLTSKWIQVQETKVQEEELQNKIWLQNLHKAIKKHQCQQEQELENMAIKQTW